MANDLPVLEAMDDIRLALGHDRGCVLVAPPGTGKTTGVPPLLLAEDWLGGGRIVMLEPRRLAARMSASRMASNAHEPVGRRFGYSVRGESKRSAATRVETVTVGLFLRRMYDDPSLVGIGAVIVDEFHERSLDVDLALALLVDVRSSLRPDLRLMVMSATMEPSPVSAMLDVPIVVTKAPIHPIETRYRPGSVHTPIEQRVADVVAEALGSDDGDVLVFLPGRSEITRTRRELERRRVGTTVAGNLAAGLAQGRAGSGSDSSATADSRLGEPAIFELHGSLTPSQQQAVLNPSEDRRRRVILSTSLAETSVTVPRVRIVIDSGRRRTIAVDGRTGLPGLVTTALSQAGADQRRGRAGRVAAGVAYRLWGKAEERHRREVDEPEILSADLSEAVLNLRSWGIRDPHQLRWLNPPPESALERARQTLVVLGAMDADGDLTDTGRRIGAIGVHPRLGAMALRGVELDQPELTAQLCALIEVSQRGSIDLIEQLDELRYASEGGRSEELRRSLNHWGRVVHACEGGSRPDSKKGHVPEGRSAVAVPKAGTDARVAAAIVLAGYPDRVARRRMTERTTSSGRSETVFQLRGGAEITVPPTSRLQACEWLIVAGLDIEARRLHLGMEIDHAQVIDALGDQIVSEDVVTWNEREGKIDARRERRLGAIIVGSSTISAPSAADLGPALAQALEDRGITLLGRLSEADGLRARVLFVASATDERPPGDDEDCGQGWPDFSDRGLARNLMSWLGDRRSKLTNIEAFARVDVLSLLREQLRWDQKKALDELAPKQWKLASGRSVSLRYGEVDGANDSVIMSVRLRDAFGTDTHPTVKGGKVPVTVELLSPAGRPVQRTNDLPGFWRGSYHAVRAELRGRYPKHPWPEEPWRQEAGV